MAHHYPPHAQTAPGYQPYPPAASTASYGYTAGYYPGYSQRPGANGYAFDPGAAGASAYAHGGPATAPEIPGVSAQLASQALQRLISLEMRDAGFESAEGGAMRRLELEVASFIEQLYERAHEYANLANRAKPVITDVMSASEDYNLELSEIRRLTRKSRKRKRAGEGPITLLPPPSRTPSPDLLSSDDESLPPTIPVTLRPLPHYVPSLPPKHTFLRTPISPPKKAALPSLEKKLKNAALVQESLKNLLLATEDNTTEDAELLGATVNWEATTHPRKRWKLS
ncbi:hypothetical protein BD309DRAFT_957609 [Dichomitus squalens]|uniref:Transcription initiation factor TFIID subunit 8 n=1 Tax=Dichomitus squalens TaxID=114155 RepID=A0A4Q9Q9M6_9APHY|nr:hypothetical protein BD309DRAFT_957609 [Dichomitus squalens]TBU64225.1 hypothetical protein BD310DRAFT_840647 [Dichomitus squalens]